MPKRSSTGPIIGAKNVLDQIIAKHDPEAAGEEAEAQAKASGKNPAAVALGRLVGLKGARPAQKNYLPANGNRSQNRPLSPDDTEADPPILVTVPVVGREP